MSLKYIREELIVLGHADLAEVVAGNDIIEIDVSKFGKEAGSSFLNNLLKNINYIVKMIEKDMLAMGDDNLSKSQIKEFIDPIKELLNDTKIYYDSFKNNEDDTLILDLSKINKLYKSIFIKNAKSSLQNEYKKLEKDADTDAIAEKYKNAVKEAISKL
jgi:hypothetical protein